MGVSNGIITAPFNPQEIYNLLGVGKYDGWYNNEYICSNAHGKTNPWSRYKPVCLPLIVVKDSFDKATNRWGEANQNVGGWQRPWFYGTVSNPVFTVPTISSLNDLGKGGVPNEYALWKYNPPHGGDYAIYRFDDFCGYNHNAAVPMYVAMANGIILNGTFDAVIEEWGTDKANGEWEFKDVLKLINTTRPLYAGIAIRNITRNVIAAYVKTSPLGDDSDNGRFELNPNSGLPISQGGFGHTIHTGDVIDVFLFLSTSPGETDVDSMMKYSPCIDKESEVYKRYTVGYNLVTVTVYYACSNLTHTINALPKTYYVNDADYGGDGNVYKVSSYIQAIYGKVTVDKTPNSDYSNFRIYLSGDCIGTKANGETFQTQSVPNVTYLSKTNGNFNSTNFEYTLNGTEGMSFVGYNSLSDAQGQSNGVSMVGCPIYDSIVDNYSDADNVGTLSNRKIRILCSAASSKQYHMIKMLSKDNNNIIAELS